MTTNSEYLFSGGGGGAAEYQIERSVRFNSSDSAYLSKVLSTTSTTTTWTWSAWVKRSSLVSKGLFGAFYNNSSRYFLIRFGASDQIEIFGGIYSTSPTNTNVNLITTSVYRDLSAWLHIVFTYDTTNGTLSDRARLYVNGVRVTDFSTAAYPGLSSSTFVNQSIASHYLGSWWNVSEFFDGYLADIHFIDGQALDPTSFGEFDTNGIWQPKAYSGGSYGTNGFHLPFNDNSTAAALGTDTSGNGNDWTVNNLFTRSATTLPAVAFDGSGDYLSLASSTDFELGSGDFTVECYVNFNNLASSSGYSAIVNRHSYSGGTGWGLWSQASKFGFWMNGVAIQVNSGNTITTGKWYHVAAVRSGSTVTLYVDGISNASTTNSSFTDTPSQPLGIGVANVNGGWNGEYGVNGSISNLQVVKGTALYTSNFTPPSAPLTAVSNTKLLCCQSSTSATAATVSPGTITANGNVFATTKSDSSPNEDSLVDSPTNYGTDTGVGNEVRGCYCTLNPLAIGSFTLSNGNLDVVSTGSYGKALTTFGMSSGKWYFESTMNVANPYNCIGIANTNAFYNLSQYAGQSNTDWTYLGDGRKVSNAGRVAYGSSYTSGDVIGVAFDADAGTLTFYKNGSSQGTAFTGLTSGPYFPVVVDDSNGDQTNQSLNFGQRPFAYPAPSGFKALNTANLPTPTIADGSTAMDVVTYTGNGSTQTISGLEFSPDLVWFKDRSAGYYHSLLDTIRGTSLRISTNNTDAENDGSAGGATPLLSSFNSDGWTMPNGNKNTNESGTTYVAWTWDAGSSTVTNNDGTITSQVRANPSAGFSIVSWTGGTNPGTVGHGLGVSPELIIVKSRDNNGNWYVYHQSVGAGIYLALNLTNPAAASATAWDNTAPSSTVISFNSGGTNPADALIAYCFAPVEGYSAFGTYTGNGSADGPFVFCNFRPRWVMIKRTTGTVDDWQIRDTSRSPYNTMQQTLFANLSNAEVTLTDRNTDHLSNGFKLRGTDPENNASGATYIYAAFAENPFKTARAR